MTDNKQRLASNLPYWSKDDPATQLKTPRLSNEIYAASSSSYVLVCVEIMLICRDPRRLVHVFLPWRQRKPCVGWWYFGGRVQRGEMENEAAQRVLEREAGLKLPLPRFVYVRDHRLICGDREEIPQDAGADYLSHQFVVDIDPEKELGTVREHLDGLEFDRERGILMACNRGDLIRAHAHHSIISLYDAVFS